MARYVNSYKMPSWWRWWGEEEREQKERKKERRKEKTVRGKERGRKTGKGRGEIDFSNTHFIGSLQTLPQTGKEAYSFL